MKSITMAGAGGGRASKKIEGGIFRVWGGGGGVRREMEGIGPMGEDV